ncbi:MAG: DUF4292 domain-containing protein [Crocinitomicaceae bacterium]
MLNSLRIHFALTIAISVLLFACDTAKVGGSADCRKKPVEELTTILNKKLVNDFDFLYTKISIDVKDSKKSNSFKATVKMKPDSAFSGSIKVAGIMGAAYLVDQDSVGFTNRLKKCYQIEGYTFLKKMLGTEVTYEFLQALILGQPVAVNTIEQLYPVKDEQYYKVASHDKKAFQRLEAMELDPEEMEEVYIEYMLHCDNLKVAKIRIRSPLNGTDMMIDFEKRQDVQGVDFPQLTNIRIDTPIDSVFIKLDYNTPDLNEEKVIRLGIPDSYEKCQ